LVFTRRPIVAVALAAALIGLGLFALSRAGTWLVVESPLQAAPAAVVFAGRTPFGAMEAARLYQAGWTRQVWLTEGIFSGADAALADMEIARTPEHVYNRQVLERLGVPADAIRLLAGHNNNTADEVRTAARAVRGSHAPRVILITSNYHTRRVQVLWRTIVGEHPEAIVRYTPNDQFDAAHWWRDTADAWAVSREWFGLMNAWARFPVRSEHW
jgi:uncharacterized SAM-binding protein YcdF (DUF218 family)